jgi:hypothetical protein
MNMAYPYEFATDQLCGTNVFTAPEMGLKSWVQDREFCSNITSAERQLLFNEARRVAKPIPISKVDMWLTGNTLLWLITGEPIYTKKDWPKFCKYVLQHFQTGDKYFLTHTAHKDAMKELYASHPEMYNCIVSMLQWDPSKRPESFLDCLDMVNAIVTPGEIYEEIPSGDFSTYTDKDFEEISSIVQLMLKAYGKLTAKAPYETVMQAITLLYRSWPARDKTNACGVQEHAAACLSIAEALSWEGAITFTIRPQVSNLLLSECNASGKSLFAIDKSIQEQELSIVEFTKGTLRFPYLIELCATEADCKKLIEYSAKYPANFIGYLRSPFEMIKEFPKDTLREYLVGGNWAVLDDLRKKSKMML